MSRHIFFWYQWCVNDTTVFIRTQLSKRGDSFSHVMLLVPVLASCIKAPFCLSAWDDWNEDKHDFFDHVMLVLASHNTVGLIKNSIEFVRSIWSNWDATWLFQSFDTCYRTNTNAFWQEQSVFIQAVLQHHTSL